MRIGFEYGAHDFDRDRARPRDLVSMVSPLGIAAEHTFERFGVRIRTGLDVWGSMAGVQPYALADYRAWPRDESGLTTAARNNAYYHGLSVSAAPSLSLRWRALELEGALRLDTMRAIEGLDESETANAAPTEMTDRRSKMSMALSAAPSGAP